MAESEKEKLRDAEKRLEVEKQIRDIQSDQLNIAFSATESLKTLYNIRTKNSEAERETLKVARNINSALLSQGQSYSKISDIQREISKNQNTINKATKLQNSMEAGMAAQRVGRVKAVAGIQDDILDYQKEIVKLERSKLGASKEERKIADSDILISKEAIKNLDAQFDRKLKLLSAQEQELLFSKLGSKELEKNNKLRQEALNKVKPASQFLQILGAIPGFSSIATEAQSDLLAATEKSIDEGGKGLKVYEQLSKSLTAGIEAVTSGVTLAIAGVVAIINSFNKLNTQAVEFRRLTGESIQGFNLSDGALVSLIDRFETINQLTQQFGFNAQRAFNQDNIQETTELRELMGLSAEASGRFAFFTEVSGQNLKIAAANAFAGVDAAFSQRELFEQVGNISDSIAITFGSNLELMVGTANEAKRLGLNLQQVDQIASGLLDIETSIANEFEAEVISGKQLNLERARFFALTNNLAGVTEEIGKNQEIINAFATGTRIEQEAIAGALNLSRDEVSRMIFDQSILNGMTEEEAGIRAGMNIEDAKRLALQDQLTKSVEKLSLALAAPMAFLADMASNAGVFYGFLTALAGLSFVKMVGGLAQAAVAMGALGVAINPLQIALMVGGTALLAGTIASAISRAKQVGDAIIPAGKGPIISTREGGLFQGTANDDIIMAPGIARGGRNAGLSQADVAAIAKAVRDGASQAQINLDGGRVSNRLQPPLAVNTRKYSI